MTDQDRAALLFERAGAYDAAGDEAAAIPLYRAALEVGLPPATRTRALIQLASSLRVVGRPSEAIALLRAVDAQDPLAASAHAFLALALHDDGKPTAALRSALTALAPGLPAYTQSVGAYADELSSPARVRAIVVGLLIDDGWVLAEEYAADDHHPAFLRLPGGGIEFGETASAAVRREFAEELAVDLTRAHLLEVTENIFATEGRRGHEIVHIFEIDAPQLRAIARTERRPVLDSDTSVGWYRLDAVRSGEWSLYPDVAHRLG